MTANWKSLTVLLIDLAAFVWHGSLSDSGDSEIGQQVRVIAASCGAHRCMVDIRFTYPAAALSVSADDVYF